MDRELAQPTTAVVAAADDDADGAAGASGGGAVGRPVMRGWLHLVAALAMLVLGPLLVLAAPTGQTAVALTVYVISLLALFGVSAAFHRIVWSPPARRRMRRADHSTIFVAIAGSYTAVAALALHGAAQVAILALVWGGAVCGILMRQLWLDAPKWAIALPYVVVGWAAVFVIPELVAGLSWPGFALVFAGGIAYTVGAVVYALKRPNPVPGVFGFHEVFHACTIVGAALQMAAIALFAIPRY